MRGVLSQRAEVKQLEEAKKTLEGQLEEIKLQLERDEYTSVSQMRCVFFSETLWTVGLSLPLPLTSSLCPSSIRSALQSLLQKSQVLKDSQGQAVVLGLSTEKTHRSLNQEEIEEEEEDEEEDEEEESSPVPIGKRGPPCVRKEEQGKRHCTRPCSLDLGMLTSHQAETVTQSTFRSYV